MGENIGVIISSEGLKIRICDESYLKPKYILKISQKQILRYIMKLYSYYVIEKELI